MLESLAAQLVNGLASASTLFLIAVGLSLIFGVTRIVNFAHGSFFMVGLYVAWSVTERLGSGPMGFWGAIVLAALAAVAAVQLLRSIDRLTGGVRRLTVEDMLRRPIWHGEAERPSVWTMSVVCSAAS